MKCPQQERIPSQATSNLSILRNKTITLKLVKNIKVLVELNQDKEQGVNSKITRKVILQVH